MRKTILITGCSSGFGRCTALELARRGWHVFATVRKEADRTGLLQEADEHYCRANLTAFLCDITQPEQISTLVRQVETCLREDMPAMDGHLPRLDALLNNAGTAYGAPIEMLPLEDLRAQMEINVIAHVAVIQAFLPMLKEARGTIINISSISGRLVTPVTGAYAASKHALEAISDSLRMELAPFGVHVVIIEPASSPTGIWKTSLARAMEKMNTEVAGNPYERLLKTTIAMAETSSKKGFPPQRVADLVVKILNKHSPRARYAVPAFATTVLLLHRFLPDALWDRLIRQMAHW
jgi:NAD(P)-dependent dehydrogenase (short-subunit alcohol dehydrogenase family)